MRAFQPTPVQTGGARCRVRAAAPGAARGPTPPRVSAGSRSPVGGRAAGEIVRIMNQSTHAPPPRARAPACIVALGRGPGEHQHGSRGRRQAHDGAAAISIVAGPHGCQRSLRGAAPELSEGRPVLPRVCGRRSRPRLLHARQRRAPTGRRTAHAAGPCRFGWPCRLGRRRRPDDQGHRSGRQIFRPAAA
jgi:hypothetical protein